MRRNKRVKHGRLPKKDSVIKKYVVTPGIPVEMPAPKYDEVPVAPGKQNLTRPQ
jgi:hypothetical protein